MHASEREALLAADRRHLWRPYTSSDDHESMEPLTVVRAEGPYLITDTGERVLDGSGAWWCNNLGHGHPRLRRALVQQAETLMHCSMAGTLHEAATRLAQELSEVAPAGLTRVFYSDDGSTSVEVGLKMAFQYWQQNGRPERKRFLALPAAYHGDTFGAMSVGGVEAFHGVFESLFFEVFRPPSPAPGESFEPVIDALCRELERAEGEIAGVIVEPMIQGAAGMRVWPAELLRRLYEATRRADTFLIADEVFTGFGRTGPMWASDHANVAPDILCSAKGLSGGVLPFAATLATERVFDGFRGGKQRALMHGHTFFGNPLGAAIAREVLAIYREEKILEHAAERARELAAGFAEMAEIPGVRRARSLGMVAALDLGEDGYLGEAGWRVQREARARGVQLRPLGDTVYVVPPLNIQRGELASLLRATHDSVASALSQA
ncbi:MAG: adenosylmethionine--8-amino-7-oxononanoate transaminase [Deltaproteobacteria bacterium]|nr:adenosylmethionine--8-amino-7-oxononanoate transaminase [Deltaproteobacteria bacterium]